VSGERVVSTLSGNAFGGLERALEALGVGLLHHPLLTYDTEEFSSALAGAMPGLGQFKAVALTSPRSAALYAKAVRAARADSPAVWAGGAATASEVQDLSPLHVLRSTTHDGAAAALARLMLTHRVSGPVLFPCGEQHRGMLPELLRAAGVVVAELICYRAVIAPPAELCAAAARGDFIVVGSGRVAKALADTVPASERPMLVAIGPVTAGAATAAGWTPVATATEPTADALLQTLQRVLHSIPGGPQ
jgi:uroporphyrinogen-III synthase